MSYIDEINKEFPVIGLPLNKWPENSHMRLSKACAEVDRLRADLDHAHRLLMLGDNERIKELEADLAQARADAARKEQP